MATQVQFRGGTTTQHSSFNGAAREVTVDTTKQTVVVQDGSTDGGFPLLGEKNADNIKLHLGGNGTTDNGDLILYHDGTNSYIDESGTGHLKIRSDDAIKFQKTNNDWIAVFNADSSTDLYHSGSKKFETTSAGSKTTGDHYVTGHFRGDDNSKLDLGTSNDLQIIHDGTQSIIETNSSATKPLHIKGDPIHFYKTGGSELFCKMVADAGVELYYDGGKKFETTSEGAAISGRATITYTGKPSKPTLTLGADNAQGSATLTNSTSKACRVGVYHYTNAEEPANIFYAVGSDTSNQVNYGGGTSYMNAATHHKFFTAANTTTTSGTERLRIDGNGRVSINTIDPHCSNYGVHIKTGDSGVTSASTNRDDVFIEGVDHSGITISTPTDKTGGIGFDDPDGQGRGRIQYAHGSDKLQIYTSGTNSFEFTDDLNILDGNLVLAGNHGIMFHPHDATDSSNTSTGTYGSDSNLLSDYEEGSANITVYFGTSDGSDVTYTSNNEQRGWYTKIGRFVHVNGAISLANKGSSTGSFYFKGLPFVTSNKTGSRLGGIISFSSNFSSVGSSMHLYSIQNTSSKVYVYRYNSDGEAQVVNNTNVANNTSLRFSLTYMVD